jgi:hypothetical protein
MTEQYAKDVPRITCVSAETGITCTDATTGHYFRVNRESFQMG